MSGHELATACALALTFFIVGLPLSVQYSIYTAYQDGFLSNVWGIISNICGLVALVIVTRLHGGLPQLVLALFGTRTFLGCVNLGYMFFKRYRWLMPAPSAVHWYCVRRLLKLGMKYVVTQLGALGIYQSQPMIITQILGPTAVIVFVIATEGHHVAIGYGLYDYGSVCSGVRRSQGSQRLAVDQRGRIATLHWRRW